MSWYSKYLTDKYFVQFGHGAGGYALLASPFLVSHAPAWKLILIGLGLVLGWSTPKEYIFDPLVEKASLKDGWIDQRSYLIGAGLAFVVVLLGKLL